MQKLGQLEVAVEDKYVLLKLSQSDCLLPSNDTLYNLIYALRNSTKDYKIVCDIRDWNSSTITNDVLDFINEIYSTEIILLTTANKADAVKEYFARKKKYPKVFPLKNKLTNFNYAKVHLPTFYDAFSYNDMWLNDTNADYNNSLQFNIGVNDFSKEEFSILRKLNIEEDGDNLKNYNHFLKILDLEYHGYLEIYSREMAQIIYGKRYFDFFFKTIGRNSLLMELSFTIDKTNKIQVIPYHTNSLNTIEQKQQIIVGRPQMLARKTNAILRSELNELSMLMQGNEINEYKIQSFLERNPNFLKALGYKNIYSKVVLERDDGSKNLIPDFILEPIGDEWCDILDIKLPTINLAITSNTNRYKFSEAVSSLQAQLREYSAFFENDKYAKRIEKKYGIKCYKPKLIGVIGNKIDATDERQLRRMMTCYSDLEIVTFNKLYEIARSRILL
jgi:hypothetical protein